MKTLLGTWLQGIGHISIYADHWIGGSRRSGLGVTPEGHNLMIITVCLGPLKSNGCVIYKNHWTCEPLCCALKLKNSRANLLFTVLNRFVKLKGPWSDGYSNKIISMWGPHLIQDGPFNPTQSDWHELRWERARFAALQFAAWFAAKTSLLAAKAIDLILVAFVSDIYRRVLGPNLFLSSYWTEWLYVGGHRLELRTWMRHWAVFFPRIEASIVKEEMNASSWIKSPDSSDSTLRDGFRRNCNGELSCRCFVVLLSCHKLEISAELLTMFVFQFIASQSELEIHWA